MHRFAATVQPAVMGKAGQLGCGQPLVFIVHGQVGIFPVTKDSQPLEFLSLDIDEFGGIAPAVTIAASASCVCVP
ncbi:MAG: hypothetical protein PVSMB11_02290 [Desulfuromonadaceae bacterium]